MEGKWKSVLLATYEDVQSGCSIHIHSSDFRIYSPNKHIITKQDIFEKASWGKGFKTLHYSPLFEKGPIRIFTPESNSKYVEEDIFGE